MVELHPISIPPPTFKPSSSSSNAISPNSNSTSSPNLPSPSSLLSPITPLMQPPPLLLPHHIYPNPPPHYQILPPPVYYPFPDHHYYYYYHQQYSFYYPTFCPDPYFFFPPPPAPHPRNGVAQDVASGVWQPENFQNNRNFGRFKTVKKIWKPKQSNPAPQVQNPWSPLPENCTTVMIRNIPNQISRSILIDMVESHCREQNESEDDESGFSGFDFLYLPVDFKRKKNLGYAFVNFTTAEGAMRLFRCWDNKGWDNSPKVRKITPAKLQGRERCKKHFKISEFRCSSKEYLPVVFSPPRDGSNSQASKMSVIGKCLS